LDEYVAKLRAQVLERMDLSREMSDEEIENLIGEESARLLQGVVLSFHDRLQLEKRVFNSLRKLDALQELLDDPEVSEVMVNGPHRIFYEKAGQVYEWDQGFASEEKMQDVIQQIVGRHNRVVNLSNPIVDTRLQDGSRVNIVLAPIALDGSAITIRKFPEEPLTMERLIEKRAITREAVDFLALLVRARYSLLISGGTSSGKTTFLNALSQYIPEDERVITIEDSAELQIRGVKNLVRLETRNANMEGVMPVTIRDLIRTALRMRPDRIIVGECRGAEAFDMLQSLNTGHDGGLTTAHGNSSRDILSRLEMMVLMGMDLPILAIRQQIASGIDVIVHLGRLSDKSRRVLEITEITGMQDGEITLSPLYQLQGEEGDWHLVRKGELYNTKKLDMAGGVHGLSQLLPVS
jgi:pilus assembly protein CpaF